MAKVLMFILCMVQFFLSGADVELFQSVRSAQRDSCGALYAQCEQKAQSLLKANRGYSERVWWHHAIHRISRLLLQIFFIISIWFLCYAWWYWYLSHLIGAIILVISAGFLLSLSYYESRLKWGIIQRPSASVYLGPDARYPVCGTLEFFTEVPIQSQQGEWIFVGGRVRGWIKNQDIRYTE